MTPFEIAKKRKHGKVEYCYQCPKLEAMDNTYFCGESGKILLPKFVERTQRQGNGPTMGCSVMA